MQGQKSNDQKLFYQFRLVDRIPEDNFYRRLKGALDLSFLKKRAAGFYGKCGQESTDTVVFFKMLLTTRFGNQPINSIIMTWDMNTSPNNWTELRNQWWIFHELRTLFAFIGLCLIVWTSIKKD